MFVSTLDSSPYERDTKEESARTACARGEAALSTMR
jgi:hypothetical protein